MRRPLYHRETVSVPIVQEAGWTPGPAWRGAENLLTPSGFVPRTFQSVASRYQYVSYLSLFHCNNGCKNGLQYYVIRALTALWTVQIEVLYTCFGRRVKDTRADKYANYKIYTFSGKYSTYVFSFLWRCDPTRVMASFFLMFPDHRQRRTTVGRTPLDE
jgi:hypothetical protein